MDSLTDVLAAVRAVDPALLGVLTCAVVETSDALHPHANCPAVYDGEDTYLPTQGTLKSVALERLAEDWGCRWCRRALEGEVAGRFYEKQYQSVMDAARAVREGDREAGLEGLSKMRTSVNTPLEGVHLTTDALQRVFSDLVPEEGELLVVERGATRDTEVMRYLIGVVDDEWALVLVDFDALDTRERDSLGAYTKARAKMLLETSRALLRVLDATEPREVARLAGALC